MRAWKAIVTILVLAALPVLAAAADDGARTSRHGVFLTGQFLVAAPTMKDPQFAETVIYMMEHNPRGALGLVINRPFGTGPLDKVLERFGIEPKNDGMEISLKYGGPVEPGMAFVLHSSDWQGLGTRWVEGLVAVTMSPDVLRAIADGTGPQQRFICFGYAGWGPRQLEQEMARDDWVTAPVDVDLLFDDDHATKWERVIATAGMAL